MGTRRLLDRRLPLNRKERFFTGTVLPAVVSAQGFQHVPRLLERIGVGSVPLSWDPADANVQFFTEYGFAESRIGSAKARFPTAPAGRDTPDALVYIDCATAQLIAIEAKVFHRPAKVHLEAQLAVQRTLLDGMAADLALLQGGVPVNVTHVALLPAQLADELGELSVSVLTWQALADDFRDVAEPYWIAVLDEAMRRYPELVSRTGSGKNAHATMIGADIVAGREAGELDYDHVGCQGGLDGARLASQLADGSWRTVRYEVRSGPLPENTNWFSIDAFLARIASGSG